MYAQNSFAHGNGCRCMSLSAGPASNYWGEGSHAEGNNSRTYGKYSHAEGTNCSTGYKNSNATVIGAGAHAEGDYTSAFGDYSHTEGGYTKTFNPYEHAAGRYNICSSSGGVNYSDFGSNLNTLSTIGNGISNSSVHNAFEVRQSGDIYIADVSAEGEYYEKPMINLQSELYRLDASIRAIPSGGSGGGGSFDPTDINSSISDISTRVSVI